MGAPAVAVPQIWCRPPVETLSVNETSGPDGPLVLVGATSPTGGIRGGIPAVQEHCAVGDAARGQLVQHPGHVVALSFVILIEGKEPVI